MKESSGSLMRLTIQDIIEWIDFNISEPLPLCTLAQKSGYSAWHFQKSFKKVTGMSPGEYILKRKMVMAQDLLAKTNSTITEIAMYLGYRQQSTFCKAFRRHYHLTPSQHRQEVHTKHSDKLISELKLSK